MSVPVSPEIVLPTTFISQDQPAEQSFASGVLAAKSLPTPDEILAAATIDTSAQQAAYWQRRLLRKEKGARAKVNSHAFLSNLPEVESDIHYRFNLVVVGTGTTARQVVELTCNSAASRKFFSNSSEFGFSPPHERPGQACKVPQDFRCLSAVRAPSAGKATAVERLMKLIFYPVVLGSEVPGCANSLAALNTVIVFALTIDNPRDEQDSFKAQLQGVLNTITSMRATTQHKLRPVRALFLLSTVERAEGGAPDRPKGEDWAGQLADFERSQGGTSTFGPLFLQNADALHAAFTELASTRIMQCYWDNASTPAQGPECWANREQEDPEEDASSDRQRLEGQLRAFDAILFAKASAGLPMSRAGSDTSHGWQDAPIFEAEDDGSEVAPDVLEAHMNLHGGQL